MNKPRGRPFQPGNTYGKGRPKGSRNKFTMAAQRLLEEHSESIVRQCLIATQNGDRQAMKLCMERVLPARRDAPVQTKRLRVTTAQEVADAQQAILDGIARGQTTPSEGEMLSNVVEKRRKSIETVDLSKRVEQLEHADEERAKMEE